MSFFCLWFWCLNFIWSFSVKHSFNVSRHKKLAFHVGYACATQPTRFLHVLHMLVIWLLQWSLTPACCRWKDSIRGASSEGMVLFFFFWVSEPLEKHALELSDDLIEHKGLVRRSKDNYFSGSRTRIGMLLLMLD